MPHAEFLIIHNMWKTTNIYWFIMCGTRHCLTTNALLVKYLAGNFPESWKNREPPAILFKSKTYFQLNLENNKKPVNRSILQKTTQE